MPMFGYLDCSSGISGDKFLSALIDAGLSPDVLQERLASLPLGAWSLRLEEVRRGGLRGLLATVDCGSDQPSRSYADIRRLLDAAPLGAEVHHAATHAFSLLAAAEARVHGVAEEDVHFHEVGAVDSVIDIVGVAVGMTELGVDELWASPVRTGFGTVRSAHGSLPVPAPATAELLAGIPSYAGSAEGEMTTPTGAALLRTFVSRYAPAPLLEAVAIGYGAGSRDPADLPNLVRLTLGERGSWGDTDEQVVLLESAIDHLSPEHLAVALQLLREAGALDVWQTPTVMKKGRLGVEVTVMARPADAGVLTQELMRQTGTLGVRRTEVWRTVAERRECHMTSEAGDLRFKVAEVGGVSSVRVESDEVERVARETRDAVARVAKRLAGIVEEGAQAETE